MANEPDINRLVWPKHGDKLAWLDRAQTIMDLLTRAGTMYLGYQAFEKVVKGSGPSGAIVSQIAMKLAQADNLAAGAAGVATLTGMGILNIHDPEVDYVQGTGDWIAGLLTPFLDPFAPYELMVADEKSEDDESQVSGGFR